MAVYEYGRAFFLVDSNSRFMTYQDGSTMLDENGKPVRLQHLVDLEPELDIEGNPLLGGEPYICTCEDFALRGSRPCRHVREVIDYLEPILKHLRAWSKKKPSSIKSKKRIYHLKAA